MAFRGLLPRQSIAAGERPFRTSAPSSPLMRSSTAAGGFSMREWLVLIGVVVVLVLTMGATHQSFTRRANDLLLAAQQAVVTATGDNSNGKSGAVRVCAHRGTDQSPEMVSAKKELRALGWSSLSNQFRFLCHVPNGNASTSDQQRKADRIRRRVLGERAICCADYDVFFSAEGTVWTGRPETVALRIATQSLTTSTENGQPSSLSSTDALTEDDPRVQRIATLILSGGIPDATLDAVLGPTYEDGEQLLSVATAVAESILKYMSPSARLGDGSPAKLLRRAADDHLPSLASPNIHASLELKVLDSQKAVRSMAGSGNTALRKTPAANASAHSLFRANSRVASVLAAAALRAWQGGFERESGNSTPGKGTAVYQPSPAVRAGEPFGLFAKRVFYTLVVIVDPVFRFRSIRHLLLRRSPEYFLPYLETKPQLVYSVPLLDKPLVHNQLPEAGDAAFDGKAYCALAQQPPVWASDVMPSLRFLSWCDDMYPELLLPPSRAADGSRSTSKAVPINAWLVDTEQDADYINKLRARGGLRQLSSVVSNFARRVNDEFLSHEHHG